MKIKFLIFFLLFPIICFSKNFRQIPVDVYKVPPPVNIPLSIKYPARLKSYQKVIVKARVSGILEKKFFNEGEFVKKGEILYEIEPDIYQAKCQLAMATLKKAQYSFNKAKNDWSRAEKSYKDKVLSKDKYDAYKFAFESAKAVVEEAKAKLKLAKIELNYTKVKAPISGFSGLKITDIGNLVDEGTPLIKITSTNPIYAEFSIPDVDNFYFKNLTRNYKKDLKAIILINGKQYKYEGKIDFIDVNVNEETSTVKLRAIFPNNENILLPGQFVRIVLKGMAMKNIIKVPQKAVIQNSRGQMVFVVENGKVRIKPIKIGKSVNNYFIVQKGLKPGDLVIVDNLMKIRPGINVKVDRIVNKKIK